MKKSIFFLLLSLFALNIHGQDNKFSGLSNFYIKKDTASLMINTFKNNFVLQTRLYPLGLPGWIDRLTLDTMMAIMDTGKIDGYRIYFGAALSDASGAYPSNSNAKRNVFYILVPTEFDKIADDAQDNMISSHKNVWTLKYPSSKPLTNVFINMKKSLADSRVSSFETTYIRLKNNLTKSVWISKECFRDILSEAKKRGSNGLRIYPSAYATDHPRTYQRFRSQSTVVLVLTKDEVGSPQDDWFDDAAFNNLDAQLLQKAAYNHGELCPIRCPKPAN
ncbi:MAG: hypothetical protein QM802_13995 [Agriterribacter sp.]